MNTQRRHPQRRSSRRRAAGLSIIELMISITLGLMILTAVITVFVNASATRSELERTSRQIENGRMAIEILSDDLRLAGFYGELAAGSLAAPGAVPDPCTTTIANLQAGMPLHVQGYFRGTAVPVTCPGVSPLANSDVLVVRRVKTCVAGVAGCAAEANDRPYLQVSLCSVDATPLTLALWNGNLATFPLRINGCPTVATLAGRREFLTHVYYLSTSNGAGQNIPTLKRLELAPGNPPVWVDTPLVEGIERINIEYGIDYLDGDGNPDGYTADPTNYNPGDCPVGACIAVNNWANVVTVQFHILARNTERTPNYKDTKTYHLGRDAAGAAYTVGPFAAPDDVYRRHVYSGLVRIINPAGRRDAP